MIGYATVGTNDLPRAAAFFDDLLQTLGAKRLMDFGRGYAWGGSMALPMLGVMQPFDQQPASVGNGTMVAIVVNRRELVAAVRAKDLALSAKDAGAVGPRGEGFFAGYFRDLDGNRFNVYCLG